MTPARHIPWQRLTLSLLGVLVICAVWRWAVWHLYTLPEHSVDAFAKITVATMQWIAGIVIFMVTGRLVYEWAARLWMREKDEEEK